MADQPERSLSDLAHQVWSRAQELADNEKATATADFATRYAQFLMTDAAVEELRQIRELLEKQERRAGRG